ncbi:hypothetical protein DKX38_005949 [Salix brachista]|uniref:Uncharacterized protein n=1 Tax=Salix brachista TaxID=2182728 RepID=A0A5N5N197_9ROSI|nr:hypothetical protein DKX38_005949 [Salix brachista]
MHTGCALQLKDFHVLAACNSLTLLQANPKLYEKFEFLDCSVTSVSAVSFLSYKGYILIQIIL